MSNIRYSAAGMYETLKYYNMEGHSSLEANQISIESMEELSLSPSAGEIYQPPTAAGSQMPWYIPVIAGSIIGAGVIAAVVGLAVMVAANKKKDQQPDAQELNVIISEPVPCKSIEPKPKAKVDIMNAKSGDHCSITARKHFVVKS